MEVERRSAGTPGTGTSVPGPVSLSLADPTAARPRPPRVPSELPGHFQPPGVTFPRPAGREGSASLLCQCCTLQAQWGSLRPSARPRTGRPSPSMRARAFTRAPAPATGIPGHVSRETLGRRTGRRRKEGGALREYPLCLEFASFVFAVRRVTPIFPLSLRPTQRHQTLANGTHHRDRKSERGGG